MILKTLDSQEAMSPNENAYTAVAKASEEHKKKVKRVLNLIFLSIV